MGCLKLMIVASLSLAALVAAQDLVGAENARQVADSNNKFSSKFYQILTTKTSGNLLYSPFSLSAAMAMLKAGAMDSTATEIQKAMEFPSDDKLYNGYRALGEELKSNENYTLEIANSIFPAKGFTLNPNFVRTLETNFKAQTEQMDYSNSAVSSQKINGWVEKNTGGKITDLISPDSITSDTRLILINAIYFKGLWENKFDKEMTTKQDFYVTRSEKVSVDMMRNEAEFPYAEITELGAKAVALPYKGGHLSMLVILPNEMEGLKALEEKLQTYDINQITSKLRKRKIVVVLPKFKIQSTIDLKEPLKELGMKSIFEDSANFKGIPAPSEKVDLKVSEAKTKVFIDVNEEGSEAAAATGFQVTLKSAFIKPVVRADHPFIAIIYTNTTSTIGSSLFVSAVHNPTVEKFEIHASARLTDDKSHNLHSHDGHDHNHEGNRLSKSSAFNVAPIAPIYFASAAILTAFKFLL